MGLQSALSTALTGLNAAETTIDIVGNNVSNSQTVGFKESNVSFATQFLQTISIGAAPSSSSGGTNPRQVGLGAKVSEITPDFTQGTIEISSNELDVAIQGDGFLLVQGPQGEMYYTRNGQLSTNQNNEVVTSEGYRVLGFNADDGQIIESLQPITIPIGGSQVNQVTENVTFSGTLSPKATVGSAGEITSEVFGDASVEVPDATATTVLETPPINISGFGLDFVDGVGDPPSGIYAYRVTYVDADGNETPGSTAISVNTNIAGDGPVHLQGVPQADGTNYTSRNIYRTEDGGSSYYLVGSIGDATTTTFTDSVNDATLVGNTPLDTDQLDQDTFTYYFTFYNNSTLVETRPTSQLGPVSVTQANQRIRLSGIPQPDADTGNGDFTHVRIYRNDGTGAYRLVDTVQTVVSGGQASYMDSISNSELQSDPSLHPAIDLDGEPVTTGSLLSNLQVRDGSSYTTPFDEPGVLSFTGRKGDITLDTKQMNITSGTTVQEWITFITQSLGINTDVTPPPSIQLVDGQLVIESNIGEENFAQISLNAFEFTPNSTGLTESVSLTFTDTTPTTVESLGEGTTTDFVVYDSLGIPISVRLTTVLESRDGNNTVYRWFATSPNNEISSTNVSTVVGTGQLTFDGTGNLVSTGGSTTVSIARNITASNSPLAFDLDFSSVSGLNDTDNLGNSTSELNFISQDGFPPGVLTNFAITEGGEITGVFSNGIEQTLAQIRMARFTNNEGLQQVGNNLYAEGVNSGEPQYGNPGASGIGTLTAGAVELSNTDIGQNLIELILASTQYRGGARVITAVQELLDELLALQR